MDFECSDPSVWKEALSNYKSRIQSLKKPNLVSLDDFYCNQLPPLLLQRNPNPHITAPELSKLMQWKLTRGKWRPRLLDFVSSLDESLVKSASQKAFQSLPDISKAVSELTVLKGVGPATASAVLASFAPHITPFMSDEALEAALGNSKDYSLKQYLLFASKLQAKAKLGPEGVINLLTGVQLSYSLDLGFHILINAPPELELLEVRIEGVEHRRRRLYPVRCRKGVMESCCREQVSSTTIEWGAQDQSKQKLQEKEEELTLL